MRQLPDTTTVGFSIHKHSSDPEIIITIPGDRDEYRVLTRLAWSFREKPWPTGRLCVFPIVEGEVLTDPVLDFEITKSGFQNYAFVEWPPYLPKGQGAQFVLSGGGEKHFIVQVR